MTKGNSQIKNMMDLKNKVALVTGGRRGIGRAIALSLAQHGAKVAVTDINLADCEKVGEEIKSMGGEVICLELDVTKREQAEDVVKKIVEKFGSLDILINNAGIAEFSPFLDITDEQWERTININLRGQFICAQLAARQMKEQGNGGAIVNIASIAMGQQGIGFPAIAHYCASKGGVAALTEALATELSPQYGIRINAIAPGVIETPMIDPIKSDEKGYKDTLSKIPLGRVGEPKEIAELAVFLASDSASYMTGSVVVADGGWLAA